MQFSLWINIPLGMFRSVEMNYATSIRMPLGMRPIGGCIPTACKKWVVDISLPSDASRMGCWIIDFLFSLSKDAAITVVFVGDALFFQIIKEFQAAFDKRSAVDDVFA